MNPARCKSEVSPKAVALCREGVSSVNRGNFEVGITQLESALKICPEYEAAVGYLSHAHNREGARVDSDPIKGLREFCLALFYDSTNRKALVNSKNMIRELGRNPDKFGDRVDLAEQAILKKDYISTLIEFESALALHDDLGVRKKLDDVAKLAGTRPKSEHQPELKTYMSALQRKIKGNWKPPRSFSSQKLTVTFGLDSTGEISRLRLLTPSGLKELDRSFDYNALGLAAASPSPEGN